MDELDLLLGQCLLHAVHVRGLSPAYASSVRISCRLCFRHSGARALKDLTRDRIEAWLLDGRVERAWRPSTYRSHHRDVGFLCRFLLKRGKIAEDPTVGIELPRLGKPLPKGLSAEQAERVLAAAMRLKYTYRFEAARNAAVVAVMVFAGLRKKEAC